MGNPPAGTWAVWMVEQMVELKVVEMVALKVEKWEISLVGWMEYLEVAEMAVWMAY